MPIFMQIAIQHNRAVTVMICHVIMGVPMKYFTHLAFRNTNLLGRPVRNANPMGSAVLVILISNKSMDALCSIPPHALDMR